MACEAARSAPSGEGAPFDLDRFLELVAGVLRPRLGGNGEVRVCGTFSGNINRIYRLSYGGRPLGARVALNRDRFKYEKDIIKEVFAVLLLQYARPGANDDVAQRIIEGLLGAPVGSHLGHAAVRSILYYDWSMRSFPFPFFLFEWVEGDVLWRRARADDYAGVGRDLASLHRIGFRAFYEDIFTVGRAPLSWAERFRRAFDRELEKARPRLPGALARKLGALEPAALPEPAACFVHNDYSGANIIVAPEGARRIIDWDNWVIDAAELDLVKMKYWTAIGPDGRLAHEPALFAAFLEGYREGGGKALDERMLHACECLWLLRTFNFESGKREDGENAASSWEPVYPPAEVYAHHLAEL